MRFSSLRTCLSFFTILRLGGENVPLSALAGYFPLAGLAIGAAAGALACLLLGVGVPSPVAIVIALGASIVFTGGLHEDGLADSADALGIRHDRERRIAVLKDSRIGTYGCLALILNFSLRFFTLQAQATHGFYTLFCAFALSATMGRAVLPLVMRSLPLLSTEGMAARAGAFSATASRTALGVGLVLCALVAGPFAALIAFVSALIAAYLLARLARHAFGGHNGDILGAIEQCAELAVLINLSVRP